MSIRLLCVILDTLMLSVNALAVFTQSNVSGANTAIEGGYQSRNNYATGSSCSYTTTNSTTSNLRSTPPSAGAPSYNPMAQDVCAVG